MTTSITFDREALLRGLGRLADMARGQDMVVDIALYDGSAIVFAYNFRVDGALAAPGVLAAVTQLRFLEAYEISGLGGERHRPHAICRLDAARQYR